MVSSMSTLRLDVAVIGGGLAGNLLARQLRRQLPDLEIGLFEKSLERSYKVGESTVEIAGDYLIRRLGLSTYLYERHLPKNGLRFFFDGPEHDSPLEEMSEIGPVAFPFRPAFQVDRAQLEADLLRMNIEDGVRVATGVSARKLQLATNGQPHRFSCEGDQGSREVEARWLVDTSGRASLIAKDQDLRVPETGHMTASAWGRFEGVVDLDGYGDDAFRRRVNYTSRRLSTVHFLYPGYWIWFIPLRGGVTSVGVVCEREVWQREIKAASGLRGFLESHRAIRDLLHDSKQIDEGAFTQLAYGTRRLFSPDRWATIGESSQFNDPFYSPGSDFIAIGNDFVSDLIRRELEGESHGSFSERLELYDEFMRFRHESTLRIHRQLYSTLGSFDLFRLRYSYDLGSYYNLWMDSFMRNQHLNVFWLRKQMFQKEIVFRTQTNFADLFRRLEADLRERGDYYRNNRGAFATGLEDLAFLTSIGAPRSNTAVLERTKSIFNCILDHALDLQGEGPDGPRRGERELAAFATERPIL